MSHMTTPKWTVLYLVRKRMFAEKENMEHLIKSVRHADRIVASFAPRYYKEKEIVLRQIKRTSIKDNQLQDPIIELPNEATVDESPVVNSRPKRN